jgi:hypothetical protein
MEIFRCDGCEQVVFFESVKCTRCGHVLAFLPDRTVMSALEADTEAPDEIWRALAARASGERYRLCRNSAEYGVCNWAVPVDDGNDYCQSCRLNHMIPDLASAGRKDAWHRMEIAKRRLLYTLLGLGLPVETKAENPERGLAFDFLGDSATGMVFTGHHDGLITINIAEADDPFREKMREQLGEAYRTVLGHFRHESGHYYWQRLVEYGPQLFRFRELFGDERQSYDEARERHYQQGPADSWWNRHVSAYASMHPWEDWAETWAHYLHMVDGLQTARAYGLSLRPTPMGTGPEPSLAARRLDLRDFDELMKGWIALTLALNSLNRSFGTPDPYPFVLSPPAVEKLSFVHELVMASSARQPGEMTGDGRP